MKKVEFGVILLVLAALLAGCASTKIVETVSLTPAAPVFSLDQLLARMPVRDSVEARWVFSSILQMGQGTIHEVCRRLGPAGSERNAQVEFALQGLATFVATQGIESDRLLFVSAIDSVLKSTLPVQHASFLIARLQVAGGEESIGTMSRYLANDDVCEPAVQAMVSIKKGAALPIVNALQGANKHRRITLMKGLGELRAREAVEPLLKEAASTDDDIRLAALFALASIGDPRAEDVLLKASESIKPTEKFESTWFLLTYAKRQADAGNKTKALSLCNELLTHRSTFAENHYRAAALDLLTQIKGENAIENLIKAMSDSSKQFRVTALRLAEKFPGEASTNRWIAVAQQSQPIVKGEIIDMLGNRIEKSAYSMILNALQDNNGVVRESAIEAFFRLKGAESIGSILTVLQRSKDTSDIKAVKRVLDQVPSAQALPPVLEALPRLTPPAAVMMLDLLGKYGSLVPVNPVMTLSKSESPQVRIAAMKALGTIAQEGDQGKLIAIMLGAKEESERSAAQKSLVTVCSRIEDAELRSAKVLEAFKTGTQDDKITLLRTLGRMGGSKAMAVAAEELRSKNSEMRDAAVRALADWPSIDAYENLLGVAKSKEKLNLRVLALRGCVRVVENAPINPPMAVQYHEQTLAAAERIEEKRLVLGALGHLRHREALRLVIPFIGDDSLGLDAAMAAGKISTGKSEKKDELGSSEVARAFIESKIPATFKTQVARNLDAASGMNAPPKGFTALFNGKDLKGWKGLVANPIARAAMDKEQLAAAQLKADSSMNAHWSVVNGVLVFDGKGESLCTSKDYGDFEMLVDWKIEKLGDSGIYLRGSPQVQIWDPAQWPEGSGGLYNNQKNPNKPLKRADKPIGEWNTFRIQMVGERVTVYLNDILIVDSVIMENYWDRKIPIFATGQLELQSHSSPLFFRNVFVRELPQKKTLFSGSLFNGTDLSGWKLIEGKEGTWGVKDGILFTMGEGGGWLSTEREFENFQLDLDFKVPDGGNSGVFIRSPRQGDPAYTGMEIQILDDYAPVYAKLNAWQYCGSLYGVQAASPRASKKANEWQHMQIIAVGPRVKVTLNNQLIVDADLIAHMDKESTHPGLKRRAGYTGLQSHTLRVEYKNIIVKELEWKESNDGN
ncbi:MAG: family 16 glycoside hydrolase [bacterium]